MTTQHPSGQRTSHRVRHTIPSDPSEQTLDEPEAGSGLRSRAALGCASATSPLRLLAPLALSLTTLLACQGFERSARPPTDRATVRAAPPSKPDSPAERPTERPADRPAERPAIPPTEREATPTSTLAGELGAAQLVFEEGRWEDARRQFLELHGRYPFCRRPDAELDAPPQVLTAARLHTALLLLRPGNDTDQWYLAQRCLRALQPVTDAPVRATAEVLLHLQQDLERQYRRLEEIKRIDLEEPSPP